MRIGFIPGVLGVLCTALSAHAQESDSVRNVALPEVVVAETYQQLQNKKIGISCGNILQVTLCRRWRIFRACKLWISARVFLNR